MKTFRDALLRILEDDRPGARVGRMAAPAPPGATLGEYAGTPAPPGASLGEFVGGPPGARVGAMAGDDFGDDRDAALLAYLEEASRQETDPLDGPYGGIRAKLAAGTPAPPQLSRALSNYYSGGLG